MSDQLPQQSGCGLVNLLFPVFLVGGSVLGWNLASSYGWVWGALGSVVGAFLSVPTMGVTLLSVLGIAAVLDWLVGRRTGEDSSSPPSE